MEECWPALDIFLRLSTQWVYAGMAGTPVGINYQSVEVLFRIYKVEDQKQMLDDIIDIESGALKYLQEQRRDR